MELPGDHALLSHLTSLLALWRQQPAHRYLRVRLGTLVETAFSVGVSHTYAATLYDAMTNAESLSQFDGVPRRDNAVLKYFTPTLRQKYCFGTTLTQKVTTVGSRVLRCVNRMYDLQVELVEEEPCRPQNLPPQRLAIDVRLQSRLILSQQHDRWQYQFCKMGSGPTAEEACHNITVMIDLAFHPEDTFWTTACDLTPLAIELLGRARDLLGRYNSHGQREALPLELSEPS